MSQVLYDRRGQVWEAQKALLQATADRTLSGEEKAALERMDAELDEIDFAIGVQEKGKERSAHYDALGDQPVSTRSSEPHPATPNGPAGTFATRNAVAAATSGSDFTHLHEWERAFDGYLRRGISDLNSEQRQIMQQREFRDQTTSSTAGGYTIPPGFVQKITEALKVYGGMLDVSNVIDTDSGQPLQWPTADDTGNVGAILAEAGTATTQDITFGTRTLGAYMYTSKMVRVSLQLLNDSAFDLSAFLARKFAERIGRAINAHFTNGTGGGTQPSGLVPGLTIITTGAAGAATSFGAGGATNTAYLNLIDVEHSIDPAYRANARWMMADSSVKVARKILDSTGQPIWQPGMQQGMPSTLNGYPVTINQDMPAMAANAKSVAFGDFNQAYVIRRVNGMATLRMNERFADQLEVGFLTYARFDGVPDDTKAAAIFQNSAT